MRSADDADVGRKPGRRGDFKRWTADMLKAPSRMALPESELEQMRTSVAEARAYGLRTCEINLEADNARLFDEQRLGPASETVPAWVEELVGGSAE